MEKKKLLLVAVSVGVVLFIIISIPLMIISPKETSARVSQAATSPYNNQFTAIGAPIITPITDYNQPSASDGVAEEFSSSNVQENEPAVTPHVTTITIEAPRTVAVPTTPVTPNSVTPTTVKPATVKPATTASTTQTTKPAPTTAPATNPVTVAKEMPKPTTVKPATTPAKTTNNDYWVQTGAFSTQNRAEGAKEFLATKGITSIIENRDIDGKTWYRVRVGPYISETEASYWLALVKTIDGFAESQIRQTPATLR
jgi:DedD protein